jgi:methionyl-tRNA synthetase
VVPEAGSWSDDHRRTLDRLRGYLADAASAYRAEGFSLQRAARTARALVREGRELGLREDAWAGVPSAWDDRRTGVALELATARLLALVSAPLVPGFADSLWRALGEEGRAGDQPWPEVPELVTPGQRLDGLALIHPFEAARVEEEERPVAAGRTA